MPQIPEEGGGIRFLRRTQGLPSFLRLIKIEGITRLKVFVRIAAFEPLTKVLERDFR